jgi:hypothetical protein
MTEGKALYKSILKYMDHEKLGDCSNCPKYIAIDILRLPVPSEEHCYPSLEWLCNKITKVKIPERTYDLIYKVTGEHYKSMLCPVFQEWFLHLPVGDREIAKI